MSKKMIHRCGAMLVCLPLLTLASYARGSDDSGGKIDSVSIGVVQPLSGAFSAYGEESQAGFKFIIDEVNAAGGIKSLGGARINIIVADDASNPGKASTATRRLMGQEKVPLVVGSILTSEMAAISPVADQFKIPVLSMFAGGTNSPYLYTMGFAYDKGYAANFAGFIGYLNKEGNANIKTAVLAGSNYEAGQAVDKALEPRLTQAGIKVLGSVPLDQRATDLNSSVTKIDALHPDVVVGLVTSKDGIALHRARFAMNSSLLFVGGTGGYSDPALWENLGGAIARKVLTKDMFGLTGFSTNAKQQHLKDFLEKVKAAKLDVPIGQNFVQGAQAAWVVVRALEGAGSAKPDAILTALGKVNIKPDDSQLYLAKVGGVKFDESRFMVDQGGLFIQWNEDGTQDVVWPAEFASRKPRLFK